jgi:hypothetical protein
MNNKYNYILLSFRPRMNRAHSVELDYDSRAANNDFAFIVPPTPTSTHHAERLVNPKVRAQIFGY